MIPKECEPRVGLVQRGLTIVDSYEHDTSPEILHGTHLVKVGTRFGCESAQLGGVAPEALTRRLNLRCVRAFGPARADDGVRDRAAPGGVEARAVRGYVGHGAARYEAGSRGKHVHRDTRAAR